MAKIKLSVDSEAVEEAAQYGDFVQAKAGTYRGKIAEINMGYSKFKESDDGPTGQEDKTRPRLEVILKITHEDREGTRPAEANYSRLYEYVRLTGDGHRQKRANLAMALGGQRNATGGIDLEIEPDPEKPGTSIGRPVIIRVKAGTNQDGEYRGEVGNIYPVKDDGSAPTETSSAFADEADEEEATSDPFAEESESEPEEDGRPNRDQLMSLTMKELGAVAKEADVDAKALWDKNDKDGSQQRIVDAILATYEDENPDEPF